MKIKVPEFMLTASIACGPLQIHREYRRNILESALRALADNPIMPTDEMLDKLIAQFTPNDFLKTYGFRQVCQEFQRIMFLEPAEKVSEEELKGMERAAALCESNSFGPYSSPSALIRNKISELSKEGK